MRKPIKPAVICEHCGTTLKHQEEAYFCDYCKKQFPVDNHHEVCVCYGAGHNQHHDYEFCSAKCARQWLLEFPMNKDFWYVNLPPIMSFEQLKELLAI